MQLLASLIFALVLTLSGAQDLVLDESGSLSDASKSGDGSFFGSSDLDTVDDPSTTDSVVDVTLAPSSIPPVEQPVVDGVKMFDQCGGVFYSGTTACADPDAYCKQLSIYSSICSPRPVE